MNTQEVQIDYLFLDNETCQRCRETENVLDDVVDEMKGFLVSVGIELLIHKARIISLEEAATFQFERSPTILVNGVDIGFEQRESNCKDCGDLCRCSSDFTCRSWVQDGEVYEVPPKELLMKRILSGIFSGLQKAEKQYSIPEQLEIFFAGEKETNEKQCCDSTCCS